MPLSLQKYLKAREIPRTEKPRGFGNAKIEGMHKIVILYALVMSLMSEMPSRLFKVKVSLKFVHKSNSALNSCHVGARKSRFLHRNTSTGVKRHRAAN